MINLNQIIQNLNVSQNEEKKLDNDISWDVLAILSAKLIECVFLDDRETAKKLLSKGADILTDPALYYLEESDNYAKIEAGPESNPYSVVIQFGSLEMIDLFLSSEPELLKKNRSFFYPVVASDRVEALPILAKYNLFQEDKFVELLQSCILHSKKTNHILNTLLQNEQIQQIFYDNTEVICKTFVFNKNAINLQNSFLSIEKYKETQAFQKMSTNYDIISKYADTEKLQKIVLEQIVTCFHLPNLVEKNKEPTRYELNQFLGRFFQTNEQSNGEIFYHHIATICQSIKLDIYKPLKHYSSLIDLSEKLLKFPVSEREKLSPFESEQSIYKLIVQALPEKQMAQYEKAILNVGFTDSDINSDIKKSNPKIKI
jgi:hypothetical protein